MQILSIYFLIFLAGVALVEYLLPQKARPYWLLIADIVFYASYKISALAVIILGIIISYTAGRLIDSKPEKGKSVLAVSIVILVASLSYFKYTGLI